MTEAQLCQVWGTKTKLAPLLVTRDGRGNARYCGAGALLCSVPHGLVRVTAHRTVPFKPSFHQSSNTNPVRSAPSTNSIKKKPKKLCL